MTLIMEILSTLWKLISDNSFIGALGSGLVLIFIGLFTNWGVKKYRANRIYNILKNGLEEKSKTYLPTVYLSAKSGYTQSQVEALCSHHDKIRRNEKKLESWRII